MNSNQIKNLIEEGIKKEGMSDLIFESNEQFIETFGLDDLTFEFPELEDER